MMTLMNVIVVTVDYKNINMGDIQTLEEFKRMQHKEVQQRKNNYKMNPVTGWIDSKHLESGYIRYKHKKN